MPSDGAETPCGHDRPIPKRAKPGGRERAGTNEQLIFCSISGQTENSHGRESSLGGGAERSISVSVYRPLVCSRPDIVAREINVLPTKRRQVSEKVVVNVFGLAPDNGCSTR